MRYLWLVLLLAGCSSAPKKDRPGRTCLEVFGAFLEQHQEDERGMVASDENMILTWATDKNSMTEWILIDDVAYGRFESPVGKCRNDGNDLNIYIMKGKQQ